MTLKDELELAISSGCFDQYRERAEGESAMFQFGESVGWNREQMVDYCLAGPSGWLGREAFEKSFDDGSMRSNAATYHTFLLLATMA